MTTNPSSSCSSNTNSIMSDSGRPKGSTSDIYESKDEAYFGYYSLLSHQAQMLQDSVRTSAYQRAILGHAAECFQDKIVMDVGAGNGILSFFAAQAGAKKVYAVEASNMVDYLKKVAEASKPYVKPTTAQDHEQNAELKREAATLELLGGVNLDPSASVIFPNASPRQPKNPWLADKLVPVHSKMEDVTPEHLQGHTQVDTIVSECLGVLLVHERMCESFLDARDRFLKPGGSVFPSAGTICLAPFHDKTLWEDTANKARWWLNSNFYGIDLSPYAASAFRESFSSPVVGVFSPQCLLSVSSDYLIDFATIAKAELEKFTIPVEWAFTAPTVVHGVGGWFDLHFNSQTTSLSPFIPSSSAASFVASAMGPDVAMCISGQDATMQESSRSALSSQAPNFEPTLDTVKAAAAVAAVAAAASTTTTATTTTTSANDIAAKLALDGLPTIDSTTASIAAPLYNYMTTSPYATPTHWQQVRFLLPEPLAVNKGQKLVGSIRCEVNESRSYTMTAQLGLVRSDGTADPLLSQTAMWRLDRQTYSWS